MSIAQGPSRRRQCGLSSLLVIAVLVMLGAVSAYAVSLVTSAHADAAREHSHARASLAARAGLDWGRYRVQALATPLCSGAQSIATLPGTLAPYVVTVRCAAAAPRQESGVALRAYSLSASACNLPLGGQCPNPGGGADYVERTFTAVLVR
ncbi:MAG: agglutinin biogenesis protein MshP [Burkholderiaceae bacterium]|nr:agglutinin biogenesis protein MshP [Burkholderiaceae bacterium]